MFLLFVAAGAGVLALSHIAPFPFLLDALTPAPSRWSMPAAGGVPTIYLTYDDGPNPAATPDLLDVLAREGAVATFFVLDRHLTAETAPLVERMFREGHAVALHSHTRRLLLLSPDELGRVLTAAADRIEHRLGKFVQPVEEEEGLAEAGARRQILGKPEHPPRRPVAHRDRAGRIDDQHAVVHAVQDPRDDGFGDLLRTVR